MRAGRHIFVFLSLAVSLVSMGGCRQNGEQSRAQLHRIDSLRGVREAKQKTFLIGKELPVIGSILPVDEDNCIRVILLASGLDCNTCIKTGIKIIRDISIANKHTRDYMIEIESPIAIDYLIYEKDIHKDFDDRLHASIGFLPTPLILILDGNAVSDMYLPVDELLPSVGKFIRRYSEMQ